MCYADYQKKNLGLLLITIFHIEIRRNASKRTEQKKKLDKFKFIFYVDITTALHANDSSKLTKG